MYIHAELNVAHNTHTVDNSKAASTYVLGYKRANTEGLDGDVQMHLTSHLPSYHLLYLANPH